MGSLVTLGLGRLELDWGKNSSIHNHSALFMRDDKQLATYYYADAVVEQKEAFVRPLRSVVRRLEMLGYTLADCERLYNAAVASVPSYYDRPFLSYAEYANVLKSVKASAVELPEENDYDLGEYVSKAIMLDSQFTAADPRLAHLSSDDGTFFENLDPYLSLRLLAENPSNLDEPVVWRVADVLEEGWIGEGELYVGVPLNEVCLMVTEGSSDTAILRESLPRVAPDLTDFFDFVDMTENYPFTGTGNLFRFAQGLAQIRIQNRILTVVDNDTAGHDVYRRVSALPLPPRMRVVTLPNLNDCRSFRTLGPSGSGIEDINGRAVSIELFLDLAAVGPDEPVVRWTSYNETVDAYQGELMKKEMHTRCFLDAMRRKDQYDCTKLAYLWEHLIAACTRTDA